jgi:signal transduction histidine kinase
LRLKVIAPMRLEVAGSASLIMPRSLTTRLLIVAALFSALLLASAGFGAARLYGATVMRDVNDRLDGDLRALVSAAEIGIDGRGVDVTGPPDPRYTQTFSGRYWAVWRQSEAGLQGLARSASFYDETLSLDREAAEMILTAQGEVMPLRLAGPTGEPLYLRMRAIALNRSEQRLVFAVALDERPIRQDIRDFTTATLSIVGLLALVLMVTVFLQVRWGLAPLGRMRAEIDAIRSGERTLIDGPVPREVAPLVVALNELIRTHQRSVETARDQAGNLAHGLKTPLSIMRNAIAKDHDEDRKRLFSQQIDAMQASIDRHLRLARAQASARHGDSVTALNEAAEKLARVVGRIYPDKAAALVVEVPSGSVRVERHDLDDMLGNLLDNAMKWSEAQVRLRAQRCGHDWEVTVEDDGPGLKPDQRIAALQRGKRLDETASGSGLGLSIVQELAIAYGGMIGLEKSALGGLCVRLRLPAGEDG